MALAETWLGRFRFCVDRFLRGRLDKSKGTVEMFDRFTDRARLVMQLSNQEAASLRHDYIGAEHYLLGMAQEGIGVAAHVLQYLGADYDKLRVEVEKQIQIRAESGKITQPLTVDNLVRFSLEECRNLSHNYIGTEHLLLAVLREEDGVAADSLKRLGLRREYIRNEVLALLGHA